MKQSLVFLLLFSMMAVCASSGFASSFLGVPLEDVERRVQQMDAAAMVELARRYTEGLSVDKSDEQAVKYLRRAADLGYAPAQHELGKHYARGKGVAQSWEEAAKWYRKAAVQGNVVAQRNFGVLYWGGKGVAQSYEEAAKWTRKAAEKGDRSAQKNLAYQYWEGKGVVQSYEEAAKWYRKAAEQGDADAQRDLAYLYREGKGVAQSYEEAAKWYRSAAGQWDAVAQANLAYFYQEGKGVVQSYEEAIKWYRQAAEQGNIFSMQQLGQYYARKRDDDSAQEQAGLWFKKILADKRTSLKQRVDAVCGLATLKGLTDFEHYLKDIKIDCHVKYKGIHLGLISTSDKADPEDSRCLFYIPDNVGPDDLLYAVRFYMQRYGFPVEDRKLSWGERHMLQVCAYVELSNLENMMYALYGLYSRETKWLQGEHKPGVLCYTGNKLYMGRVSECMRMEKYLESNEAQFYRDMRSGIFNNFKTIEKDGKIIFSEKDMQLISNLLVKVFHNRASYEDVFKNSETVDAKIYPFWRNYLYILEWGAFRDGWQKTRYYYEACLEHMKQYRDIFSSVLNSRFYTAEENSDLTELYESYKKSMDNSQIFVHRLVYDAPYCLLTAKLNTLVKKYDNTSFWRSRNDKDIRACKYLLTCFVTQIGDISSDTSIFGKLTSLDSIMITSLVTENLKRAMGDEAYKGMREMTRLLCDMEEFQTHRR